MLLENYRLFPNCVLVKGFNRSTICDLQKGRFLLIPNLMYEILDFIKNNDITNIQILENRYQADSLGLKKYLNYLLDEDYLCLTTYPSRFVEFNKGFDLPLTISNTIIDIDNNSSFNINNLIKILEAGCNVYQIRFLEPISNDKIKNVLDLFVNNENVKILETILPFSIKNKLFTKRGRISNFIFYKSKIDKCVYSKKTATSINFITKDFNENECGIINLNTFNVNVAMFTESLHFNNCLNKKLGIDRKGFVKNCPSFKNSFGHINTINLNELFINKKFIDYWSIKKDNIKICKTCEFRYICSDCRVFTQDNKLDGKPSKCLYNPITNEWNS